MCRSRIWPACRRSPGASARAVVRWNCASGDAAGHRRGQLDAAAKRIEPRRPAVRPVGLARGDEPFGDSAEVARIAAVRGATLVAALPGVAGVGLMSVREILAPPQDDVVHSGLLGMACRWGDD